MTRSLVTVAAAGLAASVFVFTARAEMPRALDLAPPEAVAMIATPSLTQLDTEMKALLNALGVPPMATPMTLFAMMGVSDAVNMEGSAALVVLEADPNADKPKVVALLPVKDYGAMLKSFGATPAGGDNVDSLVIDGENVFTKSLAGGYCAISDDQGAVQGFAGKPGNLATHKANAGKAGMSIADKAEIFVLGNVAAMGPLLDKLQEGLEQGVNEMAQMGGQGADQAKAMSGMMKMVVGNFRRDGRAMVAGFDSTAAGVGFDLAVTFREGSESGKMFGASGGASQLMSRLPGQPFMVAGAIDISHAAVQTYFKSIAEVAKATPAGMGGMLGPAGIASMMDKAKGQAFAVYPNPAGFMGGVLANAVSFISAADPKGIVAAQKDMLRKMADAKDMPIKMTATVTDNETQIDGRGVDGWAVQINPEGNPEAMQALGVLFGPGGMGGYIVASNDGVYQTMSKNSELLKSALNAGKGKSLADDQQIKGVSEKLPGGRFAEGYLGVKSIVDQVAPFVQMFVPVQIQAPADLPPIGGSLSAVDGAMHASTFVPMPVIQFGASTAQQLQNMAPPRQPRGGDQDAKPRF